MDVFELTASLNLDTGDYENQLNSASNATNDASNSVGVFDIALGNLVAGGISSAISGLTDFMSSAISAGDEIDKNSQRANMSTDTYQEWAHVLELGGGSASSLTTATKTLSNVITDAGNGGASAAEKLNSIGLSYEQIAALSPEEQFEAVVYALADMEEGSERTAAAQDLLGRAGMDLIPTLNSGKDAIEDMRTEAHDLGLVLSEDTVAASAAFNDSLTNLKGAVTGIAGNLMGELMPSLQGITDGLTGLVSGSMSADEAVSMMSEGVSELLSTVTDMLIEGIPMLLDMATQLFTAILDALPPIIVQLAEALPELVDTVVTTLLDNLPVLLDAAVTFFLAIVDSIPTIIDALVEALPMIIDSIVSFLTDEDGLTKLMNATVQLFMGLVQAIPTIIVNLVAALPDILAAIVSTIVGWVSDIFDSALEIGGAIIDGIKEGISNLWGSFTSFISDKFNGIIDSVKGFFGISSPSTVFAEIGENMIEGMEGGISNEASALEAQAQASTSGVVSGADAALTALPGTYTSAATTASTALTGFMVSTVTPEQQANVKALVEALGKTAEKTILAENSSGVGFFATGVAAGQGFIDGLESKRSAIMALARKIADDVRRTIESALDIHSPSGVFRDIGMYTAEGLALGIEEGAAAYLPDAMEDMLSEIGYGDSAISSLESAYGNAAAAGLTAQNQSAAGTTTIHTQVNIGGTKLGEIIYTLYNQQARIAGQPVFVYT